jgi:hypothetical protein
MPASQLPLLPLILDRAPTGLAAALAQEGVPHRAWRLGAPQGRFLLFDSRQGPSRPLGPRQIPIDLDDFRSERDEDPFLALEDEQTATYLWPFGEVQIVHGRGQSDRRTVRQKLLEKLRSRIEAEGGIWLCLAAYPFPYRSAFNVRLDHPAYEPQAFDAVLRASAGHESAVSHFLQIAKFYPFPEALAQLRGFDLGIQSDDDQSFHRIPQIEHLLRHDFDLMRRVGLAPEGILPPGGRYLPALPPLLQQIDFPYVVLHDLGADDLPFFPPSGSVLHVPAHPISVQTLLAAIEASRAVPGPGNPQLASISSIPVHTVHQSPGSVTPVSKREHSALRIPHSAFPSSLLASYFTETIQRKYRAGEPLFFHGRTVGGWERFPELLGQLFALGQDCSAAWKTTLSRFARWWKARGEVQLSVVERDGSYLLSSDYLPCGFRLGVEYHRGRHVARMALTHRVLRFSPSALAYENRPPTQAFAPVRVEGPQADPRPGRRRFSVYDGREDSEASNLFLRAFRLFRGRRKSVA